jgi:hypothetical protein
VRFDARKAVEGAAILESNGSPGGPREIDHFLQTMAPGASGDEDTFEGPFCAQGFRDGVDSDEDGQVSIIPRRGAD